VAVKKHGSKWRVDWRDELYIRRRKDFDKKAEAQAFEHEARVRARKGRTGGAPDCDPNVTLAAFAADWLSTRTAAGLDPGTIARREIDLRRHVLPRFGMRQVREIYRPAVRSFLLEKLSTGESAQGVHPGRVGKRTVKRLARGSVRSIYMTLSAVLTEAVERGLLQANPVRGLWRSLSKSAKTEAIERVKALTPGQAGAFLAAAQTHAPDDYPFFATLLLAGLRTGEALALTTDKIDLRGRTMLINAQIGQHGGLKSTKTGDARQVELSRHLASLLANVMKGRRTSTAKVVPIAAQESPAGSDARAAGPWLFYPELGLKPGEKDAQRVYKTALRAMRRSLAAAGLPQHHALHALRHSYAVGLISQGVSPAFVQQQMGHASIEQTVGTYGSWFPVRVAGALDSLAAAVTGGHQMDTFEPLEASSAS
jgi:integrase